MVVRIIVGVDGLVIAIGIIVGIVVGSNKILVSCDLLASEVIYAVLQ
jgi:hypothetical protein